MSDNKKGVKDTKGIVGATFEDLDISQMVEVQGAGDMEAETTPLATPVSVAIATATMSIQIGKTVKGKC